MKAGDSVTVVAKKWYTSKTLWFNVVTFLLQVLNLAQQSPLFLKYAAILTSVQLLGNILLRYLTNQPITLQ